MTGLVLILGGKRIAAGKASPSMKDQKKCMNGQFREITTPYKSPFYVTTSCFVFQRTYFKTLNK